MLIAIEGTDAAGKATQTRLLAEKIRTVGREAVTYSFPRYDTPVGRTIKGVLTEALTIDYLDTMTHASDDAARILQSLMIADKSDATEEMVEHLNTGTVVICDRWIPSAYCYGAADGLDREWLRRIHFPLPDAALNVFIDVSPEEALRRRPETRDRYERDRNKQKRVHAEYVRFWGCLKGQKRVVLAPEPFYQEYLRLDGERSQEAVAADIFAHVIQHAAWAASLLDVPPPFRGSVS